MRALTIEPVVQTDQNRVNATLVSAFIADPVERWLYPQPVAYLTEFPAFVAAFGGEAFEEETSGTSTSLRQWRSGCLQVSKPTVMRS